MRLHKFGHAKTDRMVEFLTQGVPPAKRKSARKYWNLVIPEIVKKCKQCAAHERPQSTKVRIGEPPCDWNEIVMIDTACISKKDNIYC